MSEVVMQYKTVKVVGAADGPGTGELCRTNHRLQCRTVRQKLVYPVT